MTRVFIHSYIIIQESNRSKTRQRIYLKNYLFKVRIVCAKVQLGATGVASPRRVTREIGRTIFEFPASLVQLVVQVSRVAWRNLFPYVLFSRYSSASM